MTTGVVLSTAVVVVANPLDAPRSDIEIPAIALSSGTGDAGGDALGMLDKDFLRAIAPEPTGSASPLAVLKDLVSALASNAASLGRSSVIRSLLPGDDPSTRPDLTASALPFGIAPPAAAPIVPAAPVAPPVALPAGPVSTGTAVSASAEPVDTPAATAAASAVVDTVAREATPIVDTVGTEVQWAMDQASTVVSALPKPPAVLADLGGGLSDVLPALSSGVDAVASALASAVPKPPPVPAVLKPQTSPGGLLGAPADPVDGGKVSPSRRAARTGDADGQPGGNERGPQGPDGPRGE